MIRIVIVTLLLLGFSTPTFAQRLGVDWGTAEAEKEFYRIVDLPLPKELAIEAGSLDALPDGRLVIGTRRGDIYLVTGAFDKRPQLRFHRFARGLDEIFGIGYRDGAFYVTQQTEVTRITDLDGDGRADRFETLSDEWGFANYHEFSWGSRPDSDGNVWVVLGLSASYHYRALFRGWAMKVTPDGKTIPIASGIRSAGGVAPNEHGEMFYVESQGPWNGSCSLKHLKPGGFMGHPISFEAYDLAPNMGPKPVEPKNQSRLHIEKKRVKELVPYAVVFPYRKMGQSISGFRVDRSGGKFGPFENQIFVGDYSLSCVMRATTEKINGVWQGACYPFREGLGTGILAVHFSPEGYLVTSGTNRGWPVRGSRQYALERLEWTGKMPFDIQRINIRPDGFALTFTKPVVREIASRVETYGLIHYTHIYQKFYGSPEVDLGVSKVLGAIVSPDGKSVHLKIEAFVEGHVYEFDLPDMRSADGRSLLHNKAYYTVNEIPKPRG
jgi:glucose/arabinose dehydrogenase